MQGFPLAPLELLLWEGEWHQRRERDGHRSPLPGGKEVSTRQSPKALEPRIPKSLKPHTSEVLQGRSGCGLLLALHCGEVQQSVCAGPENAEQRELFERFLTVGC